MTPHRTTHNEDEYFAKHDAELLKERRAALDEQRAKQERASHFMKCPKCGADLEEKEHQSIKVDVCPECHGLWLDQGEVDLLHRVSQQPSSHVMQDLINLFRWRR